MRGDVYLATAGTKTRPVVEISEPVLARPLVAHLTTVERSIATHVPVVDQLAAGVDRACWINAHTIEPIDRTRLGRPIGRLDDVTMWSLCSAIALATGCD